jgi:transposase
MTTMNYIGLDVHKKTISYRVKDVSGRIQQEGKIRSTRRELDCWMKTLPRPWTVAMEATIFSGWIYDHLLPHATLISLRGRKCTRLNEYRPGDSTQAPRPIAIQITAR